MNHTKPKYIIAILIFITALLWPITILSAGDNEANAQLDRCICGRNYYQETTQSHSKYDCIKCGKPLSECTCNCWCGAETEISEVIVGQTHLLVCKGCGKLCDNCTCADRGAMENLERMAVAGTVAIGKVPIPQSIPVMTLSFILILFTMLCFVLLLSGDKFHKTRKKQRMERIQQTSHQKILDKIENQADKKITKDDYVQQTDAIQLSVEWIPGLTKNAMALYEFTNALNLQQDELLPTVSDLVRYTVDFCENDDKTLFDAANGKYGNILKSICHANGADITFFDDKFATIAKNSIEKSISGYEAESWELNKLQHLPRNATVKVAGATLALAELRELLDEEYTKERTRIIKKEQRFNRGEDK